MDTGWYMQPAKKLMVLLFWKKTDFHRLSNDYETGFQWFSGTFSLWLQPCWAERREGIPICCWVKNSELLFLRVIGTTMYRNCFPGFIAIYFGRCCYHLVSRMEHCGALSRLGWATCTCWECILKLCPSFPLQLVQVEDVEGSAGSGLNLKYYDVYK